MSLRSHAQRSTDAFVAGDLDECGSPPLQLHPLVEMAFVETNPGPVKCAMETMDVFGAEKVRPPLAAPSASAAERINELLVETGLLDLTTVSS